uniref:Uncharacterized protein n=1 Tax=Arundo donax TaxID=35708 RepID=A0A0A9DVL9_ARUDO
MLGFSISSSCTSPSCESSGSLSLYAASAMAKRCSKDSYTCGEQLSFLPAPAPPAAWYSSTMATARASR